MVSGEQKKFWESFEVSGECKGVGNNEGLNDHNDDGDGSDDGGWHSMKSQHGQKREHPHNDTSITADRLDSEGYINMSFKSTTHPRAAATDNTGGSTGSSTGEAGAVGNNVGYKVWPVSLHRSELFKWMCAVQEGILFSALQDSGLPLSSCLNQQYSQQRQLAVMGQPCTNGQTKWSLDSNFHADVSLLDGASRDMNDHIHDRNRDTLSQLARGHYRVDERARSTRTISSHIVGLGLYSALMPYGHMAIYHAHGVYTAHSKQQQPPLCLSSHKISFLYFSAMAMAMAMCGFMCG
jgi:hypothetical protein